MGFFTKTTASGLSKMGSSIRRGININRRAKPIKHFVIKEDAIEEYLIKE